MSPTSIKFIKNSFRADTDRRGGFSNIAEAVLEPFIETHEGREGALAFTEAPARLRPVRLMTASIDLAGRLAVITGAASGIGRAIALSLAEAGATVTAVDRNSDGVRATAERIGEPSTAQVADLTDPAAVLAMRDEVISAHRIPNVLVNAADWDRIEPFMNNDDPLRRP